MATSRILVFLGALYQGPILVGPEGLGFDQAFGLEVLRVFIYSLAGIVALNLVRLVMDRVILYKFRLEEEVVQGQNVGAGAAEFGMYVATPFSFEARTFCAVIQSVACACATRCDDWRDDRDAVDELNGIAPRADRPNRRLAWGAVYLVTGGCQAATLM